MRQALAALWAIGMLLVARNMKAQVKQKLNIEAATLYLNSASLTSSAKFEVSKGEQDVLFTNVAGNINTASVIVNASNGVIVAATTFQNTGYMEARSPQTKVIEDSIQTITDGRVYITNKIDVLNRQLALLDEDKIESTEQNNVTVDELTKMIALIGAKREGLMNEKVRQELKLRTIDAQLTRLRQLVDEEVKKGYVPGGQLLVSFYAPEATKTTVTITYVVPGAGWSPTYDIMADALDKPIKLYYKANVHQNSGVNWENVRLTLSTGNPTEGAQAPTIAPWHISLYVPPAPAATTTTSQSMVVMQYKKSLINHEEPSRNVLTSEEISRMPSVQYSDLTSTLGSTYEQRRGQQISMSGARTSGVSNYTYMNDVGINATFDIDLPYTLPSDSRQHIVTIKRYEMATTYRYYVVPKLDKDAFLQAQITNWEDMNLLPGQSNIFYEGVYVGQGTIDVRNTTDTMLLSLGRDKRVIVKRESDKTMRSVKTIGTNIRETFGYSITIRNTRKSSINLVILDQLPVSDNKDVVVEDIITEDCLYNETTGIMRWAIAPNSGETRKISFEFTVKYPRDKYVTGLATK